MQRHISEFLGPIFAKEVVEIARRPRYYLCRTIYGAVLVFVMYVVWEEYRAFARVVGVGNSLARIAGTVFTASSYIQYWSVYLLVPAFLGGVIAGEREEHTLDLLFITPLTDREIVLGKLFSRVAAMVCLILCGVPVVSLLMLFGGISPESVWRMLAATMLAILFVGSHAIYFSTISRGPMEAMTRTYVAMFIWLAGLAILAWGFREFYTANPAVIPAEVADFLAPVYLLYPLVSFWGAVSETYHATLGFTYGSWAWPVSFVFPALWSVFLLWRAVRRLRVVPKPRLSWTRWLPGQKSRERKAARPEVSAARRARAARLWFGRTVANPLWLRARLTHVYDRFGSLRRMQWLGWLIYVFALSMIWFYDSRSVFSDSYSIAFQAPTWLAILMVTVLVSAHSLIGDRRRGFLEQVIVTPLSGAEIIDGTFLAVWEHVRRLLWMPAALMIFFAVVPILMQWAPPIVMEWLNIGTVSLPNETTPLGGNLLSFIAASLFWTLLIWQAIACSVAARTTPGAVVSAFVLPLVVIFVMPMTAMSFREDHGPALWIMIGIWFVVTGIWVVRKLNAASVGCFLTAVHLVLIALAVCWTFEHGKNDREFPMAAMHPLFLLIAPLSTRGRGAYEDIWTQHWVAIMVCYCTAIVLNIAVIRFWLIWQFDRLVERASSRRSRFATSTQGLATETIHP
jgi:ABC-type transport system involved in multi-copper enzyme maturation permease subunit